MNPHQLTEIEYNTICKENVILIIKELQKLNYNNFTVTKYNIIINSILKHEQLEKLIKLFTVEYDLENIKIYIFDGVKL